MIKSRTYIAIPPGATVKEQLSEMKMTQKEFAIRMDMSMILPTLCLLCAMRRKMDYPVSRVLQEQDVRCRNSVPS